MTNPIARDPIYRKRAFDADIIELCVRWYISYRLSYRDLVEMMAERGVKVAHSTILRWITRYVPEFEKRWNRFSRAVGTSWRVDETYLSIRAQWHYLLPRGRQAGQDRRFLAPPRPWNCGRTSILSQGARDERCTRPTQSDSRRSCAESARIVAATPRASVLASRQGADLQISEQHRRARSSGDQATLCVDGWVQVVHERSHHDRRHRVRASHSQGTVLVWPRPSTP
jgi:hypothetical protein